jgi:hypothetical protein
LRVEEQGQEGQLDPERLLMSAVVQLLGKKSSPRALRTHVAKQVKDAGRAMKRAHSFVRERNGLSRTPICAATCGALALAAVSLTSASSAYAACPNEAFRIGASANLPDCRAYEQVTPVVKGGGDTSAIAAADDGETVMFGAYGAFTGPSGGNFGKAFPFLAHRTDSGWQTHSVAPSATAYEGPTVRDVSPDLSHYLASFNPFPNGFNGEGSLGGESATELFVVGPDAAPRSVTPAGSPSAGQSNTNFTKVVDGASADLSHVLIEGTPGLIAGDPTEVPGLSPADQHDLVEDVGVGTASPRYRMVGVEGPTDAEGLGTPISRCATFLGSGDVEDSFNTNFFTSVFHAISTDGSTIFFTAAPCTTGSFFEPPIVKRPAVSELFARTGGDGPVQTSVPISEPSSSHCTTEDALADPVPADCKSATFQGASADGSRVYFTTEQADEVPGNSDGTENLYLANLADGELTDKVQVSAADSSGEGARVQGVVRISDDGSHVYYVAQGVLTSEANAEGQVATSGTDNLYGYDAESGRTRFLATLPAAEAALWGDDNHRPAQATPDGRFLLFDTAAPLTADDTDAAVDVYRYDFQTGSLVRVSGGHEGFDADGNDSAFAATIDAPEFDCGSFADTNQVLSALCINRRAEGRALSADGSYAFFTTSEPLQSTDVNSAPDVYEWHEGKVSLISDGLNTDTDAVVGNATTFLNTSASGRDVFFRTTTVLDPAGGDGTLSIYDARIGGGFPLATAAPTCSGEACQGAFAATPNAVVPGSAGLSGTAEVTEKVAKKKHEHKKKKKRHHKRHARSNRRADR